MQTESVCSPSAGAGEPVPGLKEEGRGRGVGVAPAARGICGNRYKRWPLNKQQPRTAPFLSELCQCTRVCRPGNPDCWHNRGARAGVCRGKDLENMNNCPRARKRSQRLEPLALPVLNSLIWSFHYRRESAKPSLFQAPRTPPKRKSQCRRSRGLTS